VPTTRKLLLGLAGVASVIAIYFWDDALLAAPIIATDQMWGALPAFAIFSVLYALGSLLIAMWVVRLYDREASPQGNRLSRWVEAQSARRRSRWGERLVHAGTATAFVASSIVIGGILTTWFLRASGRRQGIRRLAAVSCAIFGVTFAASYTLLSQGISWLR